VVQETKERSAPFFSFSTFRTGLDVLGQGLPEKIDKTVFRSMDFNKRHQMVGALKFFELIDEEGITQDSLRALVAAKDQREKHIRGLMEAKYQRVIELASKQASEADLLKAMREMGLNGEDPIRKGIAFYRQAAEFTGLPVSPHWPGGKPGRKPSSAGSAARRPRKKQGAKPKDDAVVTTPEKSGTGVNAPIHPMLHGAIQYMWERGDGWSVAEREMWCQNFTNMVGMVYPGGVKPRASEPKRGRNGNKAAAEIGETVAEAAADGGDN
jgi:hypothetical protein